MPIDPTDTFRRSDEATHEAVTSLRKAAAASGFEHHIFIALFVGGNGVQPLVVTDPGVNANIVRDLVMTACKSVGDRAQSYVTAWEKVRLARSQKGEE